MREIYCELTGVSAGLLGKKMKVEVDYGDRKEPLKDPDSGKKITFNSMIDALNHMSSEGWFFVNAYVMTGKLPHVHHYMMKKIIED
ncbi:MAG: hypothetical protein U9Q90_02080 [Campylobacterota bacterium]|nr:hypothetical protein [Campylobacterota bacterium]